MSTPFKVVLVTAPDLEVARELASLALSSKLCACASLIPSIESHYWWENKLAHSQEVLLLIKTSEPLIPQLKECILSHHPYEVPEFVVLEIMDGEKSYLDWIQSVVA